jgi:hypothetical protein
MADLLKTWLPVTVYLAGQPIPIKLRALRFGEAAEFTRQVEAHNRQVLDGKGDLWETFKPDEIRQLFARNVRLPSPVPVEDGEPIATGEQLFDVATLGVVRAVIGKLYDFSRLSDPEGKASSSPSTSGPARVADAGGSPATSTEPGDGTAP